MESGSLNFLETSGPLQACNGTTLPLPLPLPLLHLNSIPEFCLHFTSKVTKEITHNDTHNREFHFLNWKYSLLIWARTTLLLRCSMPVMTFYIQMWRLGRYCDVPSKLLFNSSFGHACREQRIPDVHRKGSMEDTAGVNLVRYLGLNVSVWNKDLKHYNFLH